MPMLGACVEPGAVGESMQSLKEGCACARGKKGLWASGEGMQVGKERGSRVELTASGGQGPRMAWWRSADSTSSLCEPLSSSQECPEENICRGLVL